MKSERKKKNFEQRKQMQSKLIFKHKSQLKTIQSLNKKRKS